MLRLAVLAVLAPLFAVRVASAVDAEGACQKGRYDAAAKYVACQTKALGRGIAGTISDDKLQAALSRCRTKYVAVWPKLQAKATGTGSSCDHDRYNTSLPGSVIDRLTGLEWEVTVDDGGIHDPDNQYTWGSGALNDASGTAFTTHLASLDATPCTRCDWRLPTIIELQTILLQPYPCAVSPCIDDVFGPTYAHYWSGTPHDNPGLAWEVNFFAGGHVGFDARNATYLVRAVRGGL